MKSFKDALNDNEFVVTAESGPPKGTDTAGMIAHFKLIKGRVHAVNATDNPSAVMKPSSIGMCRILLDHGIEPVFQVTCRDRNRLAIQSDLLAASILGINNVLALTGDHVSAGDHKEAKPVFDLESTQLLQVIESLNSGKDMAGHKLEGATSFFSGACVTTESNPIGPQIHKFEKKVRAGAKFFQTQSVFDLEKLESFMKVARQFPVKVIPGILLLKSPGMANYLNKFVPGIQVPEHLIQELRDAGKGNYMKAGIDIAVRTINAAKEICDGVHIMAIGSEEQVPEILDQAKL